MFDISWTRAAVEDLGRLYTFLKVVNPVAAEQLVQTLIRTPNILVGNPRLGERLDAFASREVRRLLVARYELRYEIRDAKVYVLRVWHTREER